MRKPSASTSSAHGLPERAASLGAMHSMLLQDILFPPRLMKQDGPGGAKFFIQISSFLWIFPSLTVG
jgi:hypothetical protein